MSDAARLAISTATEALSVAWWPDDGGADGAPGGEFHEVIGRGHAERLLPVIADLLGGRRAAHVAVDVGPGSFTGVRVGLAAARGLGIGWGAAVSGFSGMGLLAAAYSLPPGEGGRDAPQASGESGSVPAASSPIAVAIRAGHGEVFWQMFARSPVLRALGPPRSLVPRAAAAEAAGATIVGTGADLVRPGAPLAWPRAADWPLLPPALAGLPLRPLYVRPPDARPTPGLPAV